MNTFKRRRVRINRLSNWCQIDLMQWQRGIVTIFHQIHKANLTASDGTQRTKVTFPRASFVICFIYLFINSVCHCLFLAFVCGFTVYFNKRLTTGITVTSTDLCAIVFERTNVLVLVLVFMLVCKRINGSNRLTMNIEASAFVFLLYGAFASSNSFLIRWWITLSYWFMGLQFLILRCLFSFYRTYNVYQCIRMNFAGTCLFLPQFNCLCTFKYSNESEQMILNILNCPLKSLNATIMLST